MKDVIGRSHLKKTRQSFIEYLLLQSLAGRQGPPGKAVDWLRVAYDLVQSMGHFKSAQSVEGPADRPADRASTVADGTADKRTPQQTVLGLGLGLLG